MAKNQNKWGKKKLSGNRMDSLIITYMYHKKGEDGAL